MRYEVKTYRYNCDGIIERSGQKVSCPNTMLLNGTAKEIEQYFKESGWQSITPLLAESVYEKHICPRTTHIGYQGAGEVSARKFEEEQAKIRMEHYKDECL